MKDAPPNMRYSAHHEAWEVVMKTGNGNHISRHEDFESALLKRNQMAIQNRLPIVKGIPLSDQILVILEAREEASQRVAGGRKKSFIKKRKPR